MERLNYGYTFCTRRIVNRRRSERKEVVHVEQVRSPGLNIVAKDRIRMPRPGCLQTDFERVGPGDAGIVENDRPDFVSFFGQQRVFGFTRLVLASAVFVTIVDGEDLHFLV